MQWDNINDPRTGLSLTITSKRRVWKKIVEKHVSDMEEKWTSIASRRLVENLQQLDWGDGDTFEQKSIRELIDFVEREVRRAFGRPLVMYYQRSLRNTTDNTDDQRCLAVLPSGLWLAIQITNERQAILKTTYVPSTIWRKAAILSHDAVWKRTADKLVRDHCRHGKNGIVVQSECFGGPNEQELRSDIQFINLEKWGFDSSETPARWSNGFPDWDGPSATTMTAAARESAVLRTWLLPRAKNENKSGDRK